MKRILFFLLFVIALWQTASITGCANIIPPEGGPRDSLPPRLLEASPLDSTRNFTGSRITFTFDEFVEVSNVSENLLVSPLPGNNPVVDYKLKTVTVRLRDTLEANTTYTFNFGSAIKDFTEGNPLKNFTYTFSTGSYIDSLQLSGRVILAETGRIDTTLIVMLHTSGNDSALFTQKPRYITKLDSKGQFTFTNLPPRTFYLYALKDNGGTKLYIDNRSLFAFADKPVSPKDKNDSIVLYAYAKPEPQQVTIPVLSGPRGRPNTPDKRLRYQTNLSDGMQDLLSPFTMQFDQPLRQFDTARISLYSDSAFNKPAAYRFSRDSTRKKIVLQTEWKENTLYHIIMDKDFAEDSSGKKLLKTDTLSFTTRKKSDYGILKLKLRNIDFTKNPVLIFTGGNNIMLSFPLTGPDFYLPMMLPIEYELRILYDTNKNGVWDPGQFYGKRIQPEIGKPFDRKLNIKAGWTNEFELAL